MIHAIELHSIADVCHGSMESLMKSPVEINEVHAVQAFG
jgi:hypothetical protein